MIIENKKSMFKVYKESKEISYEKKDLQEIIDEEVNKLRMDAANAIFNSVLRNKKCLSKNKIEIIQNFLDKLNSKEADKREENFKNILLKIISTIDSDDLDYRQQFQTCISLMKNCQHNTNVDTIKLALNFLNGQSRDFKRCQELFDKSVRDDL